MPTGLKRYYGAKHLHFITGSCYHRLPMLGTARRRDRFLKVLEETRQRYRFVGYVVMPEHFHLLISESEIGDPSVVMKVVNERFARQVRRHGATKTQLHLWPEPDQARIWQKRFYDFNVWSERKRIEKLRYMHRNPVKRGLVAEPDQWAWSSFRSYAYGETGKVRINCQDWPLRIKQHPREKFGQCRPPRTPLIRKIRE